MKPIVSYSKGSAHPASLNEAIRRGVRFVSKSKSCVDVVLDNTMSYIGLGLSVDHATANRSVRLSWGEASIGDVKVRYNRPTVSRYSVPTTIPQGNGFWAITELRINRLTRKEYERRLVVKPSGEMLVKSGVVEWNGY